MKILTDPRSGSYQGITSSRNRFGQYVRTRAIPVQPRTPKQTGNRALLTAASSAWRTLTDAQRTGWNDYAEQISRNDSLGSSYNPTGAALFTGSSIAIGQVGALTDPPGSLPTYVLAVGALAYVDPTPGPEALNVGLYATSTTNFMLADTSGPVSPGITSAAAVRRWRSLPQTAANLVPAFLAMTATPVDIITNYKFLFPSPLSGQTIWFRFREMFQDGATPAGIVNKLFITARLIVP